MSEPFTTKRLSESIEPVPTGVLGPRIYNNAARNADGLTTGTLDRRVDTRSPDDGK